MTALGFAARRFFGRLDARALRGFLFDATMRVGFTVTKKIGGAVVRNRMKRRFRALAREIVPARGFPGSDHVMIGRARGIERDFAQLRSELAGALDSLRK